MCNCTSGNLEVPGSMLRIAPNDDYMICLVATQRFLRSRTTMSTRAIS